MASVGLEGLPDVLVLNILQFLNANELYTVSLVCRNLSRLCYDRSLVK